MNILPDTIIAGDTLKVTYAPVTYAPDDGYALAISLTGLTSIAIPTTIVGNTYEVNVPAATTAAWAEGTYNFVAVATKAAEQFTEASGQVAIALRADLQTNSDKRTHARKTLDAIEAVIENRASKDQLSYSIAGRSLTRMSLQDLLQFRNYYKTIVGSESGSSRHLINTIMRV